MFVHRLPPEAGLTHNLTHTGKEADGDSGADRTESIIFPEQKGPETAGYQRFLVFQSVGKDRETCPCRNNTVNNEPDSFVNAWNISDIQHFYYVFQFAAFGLTTYLPTDREKTRDSGFCDPESLLYISQLAFPTSASPFQRRSPLSSGGSSLPAAAHIPLWSWCKHFWDAFCRQARRGSSGPPTGGH